MLETPHVIVGAAIATKLGNPFLAIPLALGSHFLLERVPHWNPHLNTETDKYGKPTKKSTAIVIADASLALISGTLISLRGYPDLLGVATVLAACFASVLPDIVEAPYFFLGIKNDYIKRWIIWQKSIQVDTSPLPGLATQAVTVLAALWWILN